MMNKGGVSIMNKDGASIVGEDGAARNGTPHCVSKFLISGKCLSETLCTVFVRAESMLILSRENNLKKTT